MGTRIDMTGRDRVAVNVLASWGSYAVFVAAGFVLPRMMDRYVGQLSLGIWDLCWSLVHYLSMANIGVGSSVNRYIALYRASAKLENMQRTVSTVIIIQLFVGLIVLSCTILLAMMAPKLFSEKLGQEAAEIRWVLLTLGASLSVQMFFDPMRGVITGCHRWDVHNAINAGHRVVTAAGMIIALVFGGGLLHMGLIYLCGTLLAEGLRTVSARRVCPDLRISIKYADWRHAKKLMRFGMKTIIAGLSPIILMQTASVYVASFLGPAALAIFSRPLALVKYVETFVNRYSFILTPSAGAMHGSGMNRELRGYFLSSTRYGVAFTLPFTLIFILYGDMLLYLWMGANYANGLVLTLLALGFFLPISQNSVIRILMGMDAHGRIAIASLLASLTVFAMGSMIVHGNGWSMPAIAILLGSSLTLGNGILVPAYACRRLGVPIMDYLKNVFLVPITCAIPYTFCLMSGRVLFHDDYIVALGTGSSIGGFILVILYWHYLAPAEVRESLKRSWRRRIHGVETDS